MGLAPPRCGLALPRAALLPHLARREGALQADPPGRRLGDPAAAPDDGGVQHLLREARAYAVGRRALSPLRVRRARAVDLPRERADPLVQQPRLQSDAAAQGVFP